MRYPPIPLSEVLVQDKKYVGELEPRPYPKLSVKLYGKGVVLDEPADGATVRMKYHQLAKPGQVILSEIWAKKGAIGIVPSEGEGALVTSHFFLFDIDESMLFRPYMRWLLAANYFQSALGDEARGTTGYAAVRPSHLLACRIPLPSVDEQRRIVARIDELAALIEEARELRAKARQEASALLQAAYNHVVSSGQAADCPSRELGEIALETETRDPGKSPGAEFVYVEISSVNCERGLIQEPKEYLGADAPSRARRVIRAGDVVFSMTRPYLKGIALVPKQLDNQICSTGFCVLRPRREEVDPRWLLHSCRSDYVVDQVTSRMRGSNYPAVSDEDVRSAKIPLPPLEDQRRIAAYLDSLQDQVDELSALQNAAQAELSALLPSVLDRAFNGEL